MKFEEKYICEIETFDVKWEVIMKVDSNMRSPSGESYAGICFSQTHEIHLSSSLDNYTLKEVVYHEVAHAFNMSLYGNKKEFTDEEMCDFIGRYGYQIHIQSQKILEEIEKREKGNEKTKLH